MPDYLKTPASSEFPDCLNEGWPGLSPLEFQVLSAGPMPGSAIIRAAWAGTYADFLAYFRQRSTPLAVAQAKGIVLQAASEAGALPLLVFPFLKKERLLELERESVSAVDLCGNGVVLAPGRMLVIRSGEPNRFQMPAPLRNPYRGSAALVSRALLRTGGAASLSGIVDAVRRMGASVSLSTASKTLALLEEDLVVVKDRGEIRLAQPERLLQQLERAWRGAAIRRKVRAKAPSGLAGFLKAVAGMPRVAATGISSAPRCAASAGTDLFSVYCASAADVMKQAQLEEDQWFPDLELLETRDDEVFFDVRPDDSAFLWAPPLQCYLELMRGDARQQATAEGLREAILRESSG